MGIFVLIILFGVVILLLYVAISSTKKNKEDMRMDPNRVYPDVKQIVNTATFVSGHPDVNDSFDRTIVYRDGVNLILAWTDFRNKEFIKFATIPLSAVFNVVNEDATVFDKRVSLGRVMLVGVFALAWKKNKKDERAFLVISWNDGKFDHDTIFSFSKDITYSPLQDANFARNKIVQMCK